MKAVLSILICLFFIQSCATSKKAPPTPERIKFSFYMRDWDAYGGAIAPFHKFTSNDYSDKFHYRIRAGFNHYLDTIPAKYMSRPDKVLSSYLSVWNPLLFRELYLSEPIEEFNNDYITSFRRGTVERNGNGGEKLEILLEHSFPFGDKKYFISKTIFHQFTGEKIPKCFCLQKEGEKWYINERPREEIQVFFDLFCRMKLEVAKPFIRSGQQLYSYPGYDLNRPLPPSGNKYRDAEIMKIYIATHTHQHFNADKFHQLEMQWRKDGKNGILNYFFEN